MVPGLPLLNSLVLGCSLDPVSCPPSAFLQVYHTLEMPWGKGQCFHCLGICQWGVPQASLRPSAAPRPHPWAHTQESGPSDRAHCGIEDTPRPVTPGILCSPRPASSTLLPGRDSTPYSSALVLAPTYLGVRIETWGQCPDPQGT